MSRRFGAEMDDEMAAAQRRHAARDAVEWRKDQAESNEMWIQNERARKMQRGHDRPQGLWRFEQLLNTAGDLTGWRVELDGRLVGLCVIRGDDIAVIAAGEDPESPDTTEIMAAFIKLYPGGVREVRSLYRGQRVLPEFGPPGRDWSED